MCGENEPKKKFFKVMRPEMGAIAAWISRDWETIRDTEFDGMETGDKIQIELVEMTEKELDALPEFDGW